MANLEQQDLAVRERTGHRPLQKWPQQEGDTLTILVGGLGSLRTESRRRANEPSTAGASRIEQKVETKPGARALQKLSGKLASRNENRRRSRITLRKRAVTGIHAVRDRARAGNGPGRWDRNRRRQNFFAGELAAEKTKSENGPNGKQRPRPTGKGKRDCATKAEKAFALYWAVAAPGWRARERKTVLHALLTGRTNLSTCSIRTEGHRICREGKTRLREEEKWALSGKSILHWATMSRKHEIWSRSDPRSTRGNEELGADLKLQRRTEEQRAAKLMQDRNRRQWQKMKSNKNESSTAQNIGKISP
jgi:hypothetical protein